MASSPQQCPQDTKPGVKLGPYKADYPWGDTATTCNIVNASVDMTTTMNNAVYNESVQSGSNTIIMAGKCNPDAQTCGTYKVGGTINQTNTMNQTVASASYISNSAQQKAAFAVAQQAVSQTKGIAPLSNSSTATNVANMSARLNIAMTNTTAQRCSQNASNVIVIDPGDYPDVDIEATINQTNDFSQKCIQLAVDRNIASQTVVAAVSQRAYASATGITLWLVALIIGLIVVGVFGTLWFTIANPASIVLIMGVVFFIIGGINFAAYGFTYNYAYLPYGYSPGLADSASCPDGGYTKLKDPKTFASYDKALAQCKKDSNCTAFDWMLNPEATDGSGTSTEYKGGVRRPDKKCPKITGYTDSDKTVLDANSGTAPELMYIRPPAFRNVSLGGNPPDSTIVADVILDVDTGNIFYKMPLPYTTCTGYKTPIDNTEAWNTWVFAKPSVMEVTMASNAFDWVSKCSTTAGTACTQDTGSVCTITSVVDKLPPVTSPDRPRVFFWINPDQIIDLELDPTTSTPDSWKASPGMNRSRKYSEFMTVGNGVTLAQTPGPEYKYDYTSPVGFKKGATGNDKFVPTTNPTKNDYFLVPFPYSPSATVDMSGWFPGGCDGKAKNPDNGAICTWPPPGSVSGTSTGAPPSIVKSSFGAVYYLFPATEAKDGDGKVTGDIVPDWANGQPADAGYNETWPASPVNMVTGYGIYLGTDAYTTTTLKVGTRIQPYLYIGGASVLTGLVLIAIGFMWSPDKEAAAAADGATGPYGNGSIPCPASGLVPNGSGNTCIPGELIYPPSAPPPSSQLHHNGDMGQPLVSQLNSPYRFPFSQLPYNGGGGSSSLSPYPQTIPLGHQSFVTALPSAPPQSQLHTQSQYSPTSITAYDTPSDHPQFVPSPSPFGRNGPSDAPPYPTHVNTGAPLQSVPSFPSPFARNGPSDAPPYPTYVNSSAPQPGYYGSSY